MINSNYFQQLQGQGQMAGMFGLEANPPQSPGDMGAAAPPMNPNLPPPSPAFPMNPSQQMLAMQQQQMMQLHMQQMQMQMQMQMQVQMQPQPQMQPQMQM